MFTLFTQFLQRNRNLAAIYSARAIIMLVPFVTIPQLIQIFGLNNWGKIAIAQTIGAILGIGVDLSWSTFGASRTKRFKKSEVRILIGIAQRQRLTVLIILEIIALLILLFVENYGDFFLFFWAANFAIASNFSNSWFWISTGKSLQYFVIEAIPKLLITVAFLPFLHNQNSVVIYFSIFTFLNLVLNLALPQGILVLHPPRRIYPIPQELFFGLTRIFQTSYYLSTLPLLNIYHPEMIGRFAILERSYRFVMSVSLPLAQNYQSILMKSTFGIQKVLADGLRYGLLPAFLYLLTLVPSIAEYLFGYRSEINVNSLLFLPLVFIVTLNRIVWLYSTFLGATTTTLSKIQMITSCFFIAICIPVVKFASMSGLIIIMILSETILLLYLLRYLGGSNIPMKQQ